MSTHEVLLAFSEKANRTLRGRLDGLTSDELLWEPAPGSWSVRLDATGSPTFDFALFPPRPPVTTIAWRLAHVVDLLKEDRCAVQLGLEPEPNADELWLTTDAVEALAHYDRAYSTWFRYLEATDPTALDVPIEGGRWPDRHSFVLHILFEVIHHGAEIAVLRDLYAAPDAVDALSAAVLSAISTWSATPPRLSSPPCVVRSPSSCERRPHRADGRRPIFSLTSASVRATGPRHRRSIMLRASAAPRSSASSWSAVPTPPRWTTSCNAHRSSGPGRSACGSADRRRRARTGRP